MTISKFIKILEGVKEKVGDAPIYLPGGAEEMTHLTFYFKRGDLTMVPHEHDDASTSTVLNTTSMEIISKV